MNTILSKLRAKIKPEHQRPILLFIVTFIMFTIIFYTAHAGQVAFHNSIRLEIIERAAERFEQTAHRGSLLRGRVNELERHVYTLSLSVLELEKKVKKLEEEKEQK